jgi:hypothetical protein
MKNYRFSLLFAICVVVAPCFAQPFIQPCGSPPPPGADFCDFTCVYCDLNGYVGINNYTGASGATLCWQLVLHNPHWMAFVAGTSSIELEILAYNCQQGDGLQVAIVEQCNQDALVCNAGASGSSGIPLMISYDFFLPGRTYYLLIDGFAGDVCDFEIQVNNGSTSPPPLGVATIPEGRSSVCPNSTFTYSVPPVSGAGYYHWTAPPGAKINGGSNNVLLDASIGNSVEVTFGNASGQVCVSAGNACLPSGSTFCKLVTVAPQIVPPTTLPPATILFEDLPFSWPTNPATTLTSPGTFNLEAVLTSWLGCDSIVRQEVTALSPAIGYISGKVFWDINNNGILDFGEQPYTNSTIITASGGLFTNTNLEGRFSFNNQNPGDTIRATSPLPGVNVTPAFHIVQNGVWSGYDFGLFPLPVVEDLSVSLSTTALRPGFNSTLTIYCRNNGSAVVTDAVVKVMIPPLLQYLESTFVPTDINGDEYTWDLGNLQPGEVRVIQVQLKTPVGTTLGSVLQFSAAITPVNLDQTPLNNAYSLLSTVVGSYDPNDKQVTPTYVTPAMLSNGDPFEYAIRFQNTGNYPAEFVRVVDTLGDMVDPATFKFLASSHPCTWKIRGAGVIEFYFENIDLPDSSSNEVGSHGFVQFSIQPKKGLPLGTVIKNFCDIYFDYNTPVRTNTAGTQVVYFIPGDGLPAQDALIVRPNPAAFFALCDWNTPAPTAGRLRLFDVVGLPRLEVPVAAGQNYLHLDVGALPPGLYFVVLEAGPLVLTNKLVRVALLPLGWN